LRIWEIGFARRFNARTAAAAASGKKAGKQAGESISHNPTGLSR